MRPVVQRSIHGVPLQQVSNVHIVLRHVFRRPSGLGTAGLLPPDTPPPLGELRTAVLCLAIFTLLTSHLSFAVPIREWPTSPLALRETKLRAARPEQVCIYGRRRLLFKVMSAHA